MPQISVIVPIYNAEKSLRQCVDSILGQVYKDFEVILVDDGSIDGSPAICDSYAQGDSRVHVIHKENGGVSSARNRALDMASGEWITFVDSDDYISDSYLFPLPKEGDLLVVSSVDNNKGVLTDKYRVFQYEMVSDNVELSKFVQDNVCSHFMRGPCGKFYRRSLVSTLRFYEDMRLGEDTCFVFQYVSRCKSIVMLPDINYYIRVPVNFEQKYSMTCECAANSLSHLNTSFASLVDAFGVRKNVFLEYINLYKRVSKSDWGTHASKWYNNETIHSMYEYVWPSLSFFMKIRLITSKILH